ncbi:MAG: glycoside hydrolase family 78 protein [Candidatus Hydrogenedentes bacterium]|nr:glycoside hydrolase family 78 protein [Candidatus Hydrogenedentota bacterium]
MLVSTAAATLTPERLRCEYLENPLGIDVAVPRLSWIVTSGERGQRQTAWQIQAASTPEKLAAGDADRWDSGKVESDETLHIPYGGAPLHSRAQVFWRVRAWDMNGAQGEWSAPAAWSMGLLDKAEWTAAWISFKDDTPFDASQEKMVLPPARYYRKDFAAPKEIKRATIYATALGIYEFSLNGERITDQLFAPGWPDYHQRAYYHTYDVTTRLQQGDNTWGAILADGWYSGYLGYGLLVGYGPNKSGRAFYGKTPAFQAQLEIEYADGSKEIVITDPTWKTATGPILIADMQMGETHDARLEMPGWDAPGFDDAAWKSAIHAEDNGSIRVPYWDQGGGKTVELGFQEPPVYQSHPGVPIRPIERIAAKSINEIESGVYIVDLGQNISGVVELKVKGPSGTRVQLRHGEMLHQDGTLMTENLRKALATDVYILKGDPDGETWRPRFTFHGFQFVEVTGLPEAPTPDTVTGVVIHSDTPLRSQFACSDDMVNQLFSNIVWTQRANFLELPTDCPQRDERLGWTGDAQIYARTATINADVGAFFTKWIQDLEEAQKPNGAYPEYAPHPMNHGRDGISWGTGWMDAGVIVPYAVYQAYGDTRVIERHYDAMARFMEFRRSLAPDFQGVFTGNDWGDWLSLSKTPIEYIDACYFYYTASRMAEMADAIGKTENAAKYRDWMRQIQARFVKNYLNDDASLAVRTQTAYAVALNVGILPEGQRGAAGDRLAALIAEENHAMSTGFIGTHPLLPALTDTGHHDLAVRLLQNRKYPSWGFPVVNGATTVWERWNSYTIEGGFVAGMNSFSHYAFGAVCEWMFTDLAGIDTDGPSYKHIILRPGIPSAGSNPDFAPIEWVEAEYDSIRGKIKVAWKKTESGLECNVTIPANTTATLELPVGEGAVVTEGGRALAEAGIAVESDGKMRLAAGSYQIVQSN